MLYLLQSLYIMVLTPVSRFTEKISDRARNICIQIVCFCFPLYFIYFYTWVRYRGIMPECLQHHIGRHILGCIILLLLILLSLDQTPTRITWNKWIMYPMVISGVWMVIISFVHPVGDGYRMFAFMLIFVYPCLYFVWNNRGDYEKLFTPIARAVVVVGILFFISCFILAANGEMIIISGRCTGQLMDPNMFSMVGMVCACGALYLLISDRTSNICFIFYCIALGCGLSIVWMGQSRISLGICFVNSILTLFFYLRYCKKGSASVVIVKYLCILATCLIMILLSSVCVDLQKGAEAQKNAASQTTQQTEGTPSDEQSQDMTVIDRLSKDENATWNTYTAGRYEIWKGYWQFMNLTGNDFSKADWQILTQGIVSHAHNNFLEMAYRFGVPLGIVFVFFELVACIIALKFLFFNRQKRVMLLWPILFIVMFFFESVFDIATLPFERDAPFYFYLALIPMVCGDSESSG